MRKSIACAMLVATLAAGGCGQVGAGPEHELPAPANTFLVTTGAGRQLTGTPARIDIRYADATKAPDVEIMFSASGEGDQTWSVLATAPADFLDTQRLTARVVDGRIVPGTATVQMRVGLDDTAASGGLLSLRLYAGRLEGEASRMGDALAARFEGPFVVTCAVPPVLMPEGTSAPSSGHSPQTLIVDEAFESAPCRPYATFGGWSR